jgi:FlaG/FlaF family flagellin (archaellin)
VWGTDTRRRGASSVVGIVLLVGVVVIVGATLSVFALDVTESADASPPQGSFDVETCHLCESLAVANRPGGGTTNFINITYTDGETMAAENVLVTLDGDVIFDPSKTGKAAYTEPANWDGAGTNQLRWSSTSIQAGEVLILEDDADGTNDPTDKFADGDTIRVVWQSPDGDTATVLVEHTIQYEE